MELKIRYNPSIKSSFTFLLNKNLYSFVYINKKINEKSINRILIKEIVEPKTIETGIKENSKKK